MGRWRSSWGVVGVPLAIFLVNACGSIRFDFERPTGDASDADAASDGSPPATDASAGEAGPCRRDASSGDTAWLRDECLWEAVPALDACEVYQARLPDPGYPIQEWSTCGTGCRVVEPNILVPYVKSTQGYFSMERGWSDGEKLYATITIGAADTPSVTEIVDVDTFAIVAAFQTRHTTGPGGYADCGNYDVVRGFGPQLMLMFEHNAGTSSESDDWHTYFARSRYRETPVLEPVSGQPTAGTEVGGLAFSDTHWSYAIGGSLYFTDDWTTPPPHQVGASAVGASLRRSFGDRFYWLEGPQLHFTKVRTWSPTSGASDMLQRPDTVWITDAVWGTSGLVWLEGQSDATGLFGDLTLLRIPDPGSPTSTAPTQIAKLTGEYSPGIVAGGDYFSTVTCSDATFDNQMIPAKCPLVVVRLSDGKTWTLGPPAADRWWAEPRFIDDQRLLVGDHDHPHFWGHGSQKLYLFDVNALDEIQQQFPPP